MEQLSPDALRGATLDGLEHIARQAGDGFWFQEHQLLNQVSTTLWHRHKVALAGGDLHVLVAQLLDELVAERKIERSVGPEATYRLARLATVITDRPRSRPSALSGAGGER